MAKPARPRGTSPRVGVGPAFAPLMLYGAAVLDLLVGLATLVMSRLGWLWLLQLAHFRDPEGEPRHQQLPDG